MGSGCSAFLSMLGRRREAIYVAIAVLFSSPFLFWEVAPGNLEINRTVAVTILMAVLWMTEAIPIPITSLLPLFLFPLLEIAPAGEVSKSYWNDTVWLFLSSSLVATAMEKVGNRPVLLVAGFMLITSTISMILSNSATTVMMTPLATSILGNMADDSPSLEEQDEAEKEKEGGISVPDDEILVERVAPLDGDGAVEQRRLFSAGLLLGIAYAASIGGFSTLIGTGTNLVFTRIFSELFPLAPELSFAVWFFFAWPLSLVFLFVSFGLLYLLFCRRALRERAVHFDSAELSRQYHALGPIGYEEAVISGASLALIFLWFSMDLWSGPLFSGYVDYGTLGMLFAILFWLWPSRTNQGKSILDWEDISKVPWGVLFLLGGGFALADAFEDSGLSLWIGVKLQFFTTVPPVFLVCLVSMTITGLTELTSNAATASILLPIIAALAVGIHQNPLLLMIPATLACSNAFMLPVATPPNAVVFASGRIRMSEMVKSGAILNLTFVFLNTAWIFLYLPLWQIELGVLPAWALPSNATEPPLDRRDLFR